MSGDSSKVNGSKFSFDLSSSRFEPKRSFRWRLEFDNLINHIPPQYIVSVTKPSITWEQRTENLIGAVEYISTAPPQKSPIEIVCIDDEQNLVGNWLHYYLAVSGVDTSYFNSYDTTSGMYIEKTRNIEIFMLNELGYDIESFELQNAWISGIKHSDLSYSETGLATYSITISYSGYKYKVSSESSAIAGNTDYDKLKTKSDKPLIPIDTKKNEIYHGRSKRKIVSGAPTIPASSSTGGYKKPKVS